jgi:hypothetical protein
MFCIRSIRELRRWLSPTWLPGLARSLTSMFRSGLSRFSRMAECSRCARSPLVVFTREESSMHPDCQVETCGRSFANVGAMRLRCLHPRLSAGPLFTF